MEADVALHTSEKWASGSDPRSEKIKYVYSNRRKEREAREAKSSRKASRLQQIKPSRSYDNEIEAAVKEPESSQPPPVPKTKDDSSMRYGEQTSRHQGRSGFSGIPTPSSSPYAARKSPNVAYHGGNSETRWKPKDRKSSPRERRKNLGFQSPRTVEKQNSLSDISKSGQHPDSKRLKPAKSVDDTLSLKSSIPTPQSIVLEVKDGPSIRFKPSETMLSDTTEIESYSEVISRSPDNTNSSNSPAASSNLHQPGAVSKSDHSRTDRVRICPDDRPLPTLQKSQDTPKSDNLVFHNVSEASQRRYGVKHDDIVVGPAAHRQFPSQFDPAKISDEAAFSSMSLMSQQKAGIRHDDIVVGPNAKKQKASVHQMRDVQSKISPGLPPIPQAGSKSAKGDSGSYDNNITPLDHLTQDIIPAQDVITESGTYVPLKKDTVGSTLERESRIPRPAERVKDTEQKQRGGSPGCGIPVPRRDRSMDMSQDSLRGASPAVSDTSRHQPRSPVSLEEDSKSDRNYGSVDRAKWRPKPGKSGLHRMKRGAKREANVSTESGYATDQMPSVENSEMKISPQRGLDLIERFQRIGGSCNDIDKDLEEMVLDSRPVNTNGQMKKQGYTSSATHEANGTSFSPKRGHKAGTPSTSKSRSKLNQNTPVKKQDVEGGSKQNALSNIPIPVSHDEPFRKPTANCSDPPDHHHLHDSQPSSSLQSSSALEGPISKQKLKSSKQSPDDPRPLPSSSSPPQSQTVPSSQPASYITTITACTAGPIKPRLHRSAEHLVGNTKLSIFHSTDNVKHQPDSASDVSSTTSSNKTSKSAQECGAYRKKNKRNLDIFATPKRTEKPVKGRSVSMLRRESDRSVAIVRRGSDRAIPVSRNDPSVQNLKAATSLKELCQSVASLLNIDNEKAAEMLSTSLSKRRDLVEGLDADAILDYLTHHGVLDPSVLDNFEGKKGDPAATIQRNSAILKHVEEHGDTAVALFINALRQSGQLHLASSLDTEQRIKPMSGHGYLDKPRHKGEIVVRLSVEALKILAPREPPSERNVNMSLLSSPSRELNLDFVDSEEDYVKPRSCWCFCVSRKRRTRSSSRKEKRKQKYEDQPIRKDRTASSSRSTQCHYEMVDPASPNSHQMIPAERNMGGRNNTETNTPSSFSSPSCQSSSVQAKSKPGKEKKKKNKPKSKSSGKPFVPGSSEDPARSSSHGESKQIPRNLDLGNATDQNKRTKDNTDGVIMEYDHHLELVKLRACHDELASPTRQAGPVGIMVEQWKSSGKHFLVKSDLLCSAIVEEFLTDIIKYFEQDRGTLVLDVVSEATSVTVFNICMTKNQVAKLEKDHIDGSLLEKLQEVFMSRLDIAKFDIRGVRFCTEVDGNQLKSVLSELS